METFIVGLGAAVAVIFIGAMGIMQLDRREMRRIEERLDKHG